MDVSFGTVHRSARKWRDQHRTLAASGRPAWLREVRRRRQAEDAWGHDAARILGDVWASGRYAMVTDVTGRRAWVRFAEVGT